MVIAERETADPKPSTTPQARALFLKQEYQSIVESQEVKPLRWWQKAVAYQIYPATFNDLNGDGIGDLEGIKKRLNYLNRLGIDMLWLSPIYPSPMKDGGYDVANYTDIDPRFGTLKDFDELIKETNHKGIRIVMDLIMNHTSSNHPWFKEAKSSKDNPRRDWYVWRDPKPDGSAPNNWQSFFGGSAWTFDRRTKQYYLHKFDVSQPDLNLRNPKVREAMKDAMRFWLDRGVGGFRMDVLDHIFEDPTFSDVLPNPNYKRGNPKIDRGLWKERYIQYSEVYDWTREVMDLLRKYDAVGIGEIGSDNLDHIASLYKEGLDLPFNFRLLYTPFEANAIKNEVETYLSALPPGVWPNFVLGNHDNSRLARRIGEKNVPMAKMMLLTLPGIPFIYNGDEISMIGPADGKITPLQNKDPQGRKSRLGIEMSRDPARTPMQWDGSPLAGFSENIDNLWLPIGNNGEGKNVEDQIKNPKSLLNFVIDLISIRRKNPALIRGKYVSFTTDVKHVFIYGRQTEGQKIIVALNFSGEKQKISLPKDFTNGIILISTNRNRDNQSISDNLELEPNQGYLIEQEKYC